MAIGIAFKNIVDNFVALIPAKVNVKVGRRAAVRINKALEVEIKGNGVDFGNAQAIGNQGICSAAAPNVVEAPHLRIADNIVGNEEVRGKVHLANHLYFPLKALVNFLARIFVALFKAIAGQFFEQQQVVFLAYGKGFPVLGLSRSKEMWQLSSSLRVLASTFG